MTSSTSNLLDRRAIDDLADALTGSVVRPGDDDYDDARTVYGGVGEPAVVVRASTPADVSAAIRFARAHGLLLSVRSGGHSGSGFSTNTGGLVVDLRGLDEIEIIDEDAGLVRIGSGALWGTVATTLEASGLALSSGDTVSVGVGGLTLGGGIGWMVRSHGLALDNLLEATVVTADGAVLTVGPDKHPDLFWAMRGGGGNFGIVTSFVFRAHRLNGVYAGLIRYGSDRLAAVLAGWRSVMRDAPEELNTTFVSMPDFPGMPGGVQLFVCFAGDDEAAASAAVAPLLALPGLVSADIEPKPYADILEEAHPPEGMVPVINNAFARELSDELIAGLDALYESLAGSVLMIRSLSGAFNRVPAAATAFPWRDSEALVISAAFLPPDAPAGSAERINEEWGRLSTHLQGLYGGFSAAKPGEATERLYPPEVLDRLSAIKHTYDPDNVFSQNHNIRPVPPR